MDPEAMRFLQRMFDSLNTEIGQLATKSDISLLKQRMDKLEMRMAEANTCMLHYTKTVESMMSDFSESHLAVENRIADVAGQLEDVKRRVAALEKRLPPA